MRASSVRTMTLIAVLAAAAVPLTACSYGAGSASHASGAILPAASHPSDPQGTGPVSAGTSASVGPSSAGSADAGAGGASGSSQDQAAGSGRGLAPCRTGQLAVAQVGADVGAGQYYSRLAFTNISGTSCTLTGYPGVSYVKGGGIQSGNAAQRSGGQPVVTVVLKPHGTASAVFHDSNGMGGYSPGQCGLTMADGLRIYPPNQKAALFLPWKTEHCAGADVHSLTIGAVGD